MTKRTWVLGAGAALAAVAIVLVVRGYFSSPDATAQTPAARPVPVDVVRVVKNPTPVRLDAIGNVSPIASVAIRARVDSVITGVHFRDGASVKEGDLLFTLDSRALQAQVKQAEGTVARDRAQLEGAQRDVRRYTDLVTKGATPQTNLDNSKTQADTFNATLMADQAALENLKVQLSYTTIRAPISGRMSVANVKVGNFVRAADTTSPLATINQMKPIYVSFALPQKNLPAVRQALGAETTTLDAIIPGSDARTEGQVTMIDNTVDPATGMVTVRATMQNQNEALWPGTLVNTQLTLRMEDAVVVPSVAVQVSQTGNYVYVIKDGAAAVRPVKVERTLGSHSIIADGLSAGEMVVTDGALLLSNGSKVAPREAKTSSLQ